VLGEPGSQVIGLGQGQGAGLVDGLGRLGRALRPSAISARIASTEPSRPSVRWPPGRTSGPGGADGIQRVRLALSAPVLAAERSTSTTRIPAAVTCRATPAP